MMNSKIPFQLIDWDKIEKTGSKGETGTALSQTIALQGLTIRIVEYSKGYKADHWCQKGHIVHCLEGDLTIEMENGESFELKQGMSFVVSDDLSSHRSVTKTGAKLLITDGEFLSTLS